MVEPVQTSGQLIRFADDEESGLFCSIWDTCANLLTWVFDSIAALFSCGTEESPPLNPAPKPPTPVPVLPTSAPAAPEVPPVSYKPTWEELIPMRTRDVKRIFRQLPFLGPELTKQCILDYFLSCKSSFKPGRSIGGNLSVFIEFMDTLLIDGNEPLFENLSEEILANPMIFYRNNCALVEDFPEIDFSRSVMIGDSLSDMIFGKQLGMITVFIDGKEEEIIKEEYIDYKFGSLYEFATYLRMH